MMINAKDDFGTLWRRNRQGEDRLRMVGQRGNDNRKKMTAAGTIWLDPDDFAAWVRGDKNVVRIQVYAKSSAAATGVTVTALAFGYNRV